MQREIFSVPAELSLDSNTLQKLQKLKTYTNDREILKNVDKVAFNQEDLSDLLDNGENKIYLCDNNFIIPLRLKNKTYVGVKNAVAIIRSNDVVNFESLTLFLDTFYCQYHLYYYF